MADESPARTWVDFFDEYFEGEEWGSNQISEIQPDLEFLLVQSLCTHTEFATGAEEMFSAAEELIWDKDTFALPNAPLPNVTNFVPLSAEEGRIVKEAAEIAKALLAINGHDIINFDLPEGAIEDTDSGFSANEWALGALTRDEDEPFEIDISEPRENISFISEGDFEYLFDICLVEAQAIDLTPELLSNVERILPRVREVLDLNRFAHPTDEHPHTAALVAKYVQSPWTFLRAIAAQSELITDNQLVILASDGEPYVRLQIAKNPNIPAEILESLASDTLAEVRTEVAKNSSTSIEILRAFSRDSENYVRLEVARNQAAPAEILETLLTDVAVYNGNYFVRQAVAEHPNVTMDQLNILAADASDPGVRANAIANPQFPTERILQFFEDDHVSIQAKESYCSRLDGNPDIFREILNAKGDELETYQRALAANSATPIDILQALALTQNHWVTWNLKFNPSITEEIKATLALLEEKH